MSEQSVEAMVDGMPVDIEPGFTQHRVQEDIEFLALVMPDKFEAFVDWCIWKAKHTPARRRTAQ